MGETPHGIIPAELFTPGSTAAVMQFLSRLHVDSHTKSKLFRIWAVQVGVRISASQISAVRETGIDAGGPIT